ncbi:hypothetical protein BSL78_12689 [Apostichopus japonicus]|uniref:Kazal-like domain-containing protein n=1 Tax=Stichopus japonicus TaxID=307972 RepID=A0A2G8KR87_STIJA|nr:hypothetical protein BSL78_12689 [Apostichopus japonicus]
MSNQSYAAFRKEIFVITRGELGETSCSFFCDANFHPVCGELPNGDFKAYPNACELHRALCYGDAASDAADIKCHIEREELVFSHDSVFSGFDDGTQSSLPVKDAPKIAMFFILFK